MKSISVLFKDLKGYHGGTATQRRFLGINSQNGEYPNDGLVGSGLKYQE